MNPQHTQIPKDRNYPDDAGQCSHCNGQGCHTCNNRGWLSSGHEHIRMCALQGCNRVVPPHQGFGYCSTSCERASRE